MGLGDSTLVFPLILLLEVAVAVRVCRVVWTGNRLSTTPNRWRPSLASVSLKDPTSVVDVVARHVRRGVVDVGVSLCLGASAPDGVLHFHRRRRTPRPGRGRSHAGVCGGPRHRLLYPRVDCRHRWRAYWEAPAMPTDGGALASATLSSGVCLAMGLQLLNLVTLPLPQAMGLSFAIRKQQGKTTAILPKI